MSQHDAEESAESRRGIKPRSVDPVPRVAAIPYDRTRSFRPDLLERIQAVLEQKHGMSYSISRKGLKAVHVAALGIIATVIDDEHVMKDIIGAGTILLPTDFDPDFRNLTAAEVKIAVEAILRAINRRLELDDYDFSQ